MHTNPTEPGLTLSRRKFMGWSSVVAAAALLAASPLGRGAAKPGIKAVLFDGFAIWDPRPVNQLAEQLFPGKGAALMMAWRARQFEYQWLRVAMARYADFWQATADALEFAAEQLKLDLSAEKQKRLMQAHLELKAWPDTIPALQMLKQMEIRLAPLSNLTRSMLDANIDSSGMRGIFDQVLSTDQIKTYKPDPRAYRMGMEAYPSFRREEFLFIPSAGWDAAGAKSFGYPTFWNNRVGLPMERLDVKPDGTGQTLDAMVAFIKAWR